jgi:hypothetical protein
MNIKSVFTAATCAALLAASALATADEIVRWVDNNGRIHFTSAQLAPPQQGKVIEVEDTNSMDVPTAPPARKATGRPAVATLQKPERVLKPRLNGYSREIRKSW